jgi:hypothetical protein
MPAATFKLGRNLFRSTDKNYLNSQIACGGQRTINLSVRRVVASHRVENDLSRKTGFSLRLISHRRFFGGLGLFDLHNLTVFVVAALRAHPVLQSRLLAIGTKGGLGRT